MGAHGMSKTKTEASSRIDRQDLIAALVVGLTFALVKAVAFGVRSWHVGGTATNVPFLMTVAYIVWRARREPDKLDAWGLTTPVTSAALGAMVALLALAVAILAGMSHLLGGEISFEPAYVFRMIDYVIGAFPQQFFMCSVGLVTLAQFPVLRGNWRLPLLVGLCFGAAHFWTPEIIPGSPIPFQVIGTIPLGFFAAWYFLRFRTILPLTVIHVVAYVLYTRWVAAAL